ncbi:4Fe-4S dicluster domain-containing protein [Chengkuizengella axinellae]|uniref:4Fe-4S binding protein n=1 Tax=Chengkuizengella axinellae TaxID=3064388 RepID=A0ABT9IZ06_9BACL|nr:4Fe-4S binding protein [Chengkuizengella sp. 2205SS18-9]MDP5274606.1 4Fe-4S binding protein [Chengkuizengella sp. 2205SS18-9]
MAWVITAPCEGEVAARCVSMCPENAIEQDQSGGQYYINPKLCTDCGLCDLSCPVAAIFPKDKVPYQWKSYINKNKQYFENKENNVMLGEKTVRS